MKMKPMHTNWKRNSSKWREEFMQTQWMDKFLLIKSFYFAMLLCVFILCNKYFISAISDQWINVAQCKFELNQWELKLAFAKLSSWKEVLRNISQIPFIQFKLGISRHFFPPHWWKLFTSFHHSDESFFKWKTSLLCQYLAVNQMEYFHKI